MAYCAYCKTHILDRAHKCPNCGSTVFRTDDEPAPEPVQPEARTVYVDRPVYHTVYVEQPAPMTQSESNWLATLLLCLFGGGLGLHRFYVGKVGTGVLYLFTLGWCGLGPLIDLIMIATGSFRDKAGLPVKR